MPWLCRQLGQAEGLGCLRILGLGFLGFWDLGLGLRDKGAAVSRFRVWGFGMVLGMSYLLNYASS